MQVKRVLDGQGKVTRVEQNPEWDARLRKLVQDMVDSGEMRDAGEYFDLPDDLVMPAGIEPHPVKELAAAGAKIVTLDFQVRAAESDSPDSPTLVFRATDESEDRHGSVIRFGGWDWSWYMRTGEGVFLYCHDYEFPSIGKTTDISKLIALKAYDFTVQYAIAAWNVKNMPNFADLCYRLAKDNFMPQVSVGFIPKNAKAYTPKTLGIFGSAGDGIEFLEQEGLELSQVTVGSNRNAYGVKAAIRRGIVSESEITASGIGRLLFNSRDVIEINTLPEAFKALRDPERRAKFVTDLPTSARADGGDVTPATDPKPPKKKPAVAYDKALYGPQDASLPSSQREISSMQAILANDYSMLDVFLQGFRNSQHDSFRYMCANGMSSCMCRIADMLYFLEYWYSMPVDLGEFVVTAQEMEDAIEDEVGEVTQRSPSDALIAKAFSPLAELKAVVVKSAGRRAFKIDDSRVTTKSVREIVQRVGKVLSKKNYDKLISAMSLIEEVCIDGGYDPADVDADLDKVTGEEKDIDYIVRLGRALIGASAGSSTLDDAAIIERIAADIPKGVLQS